MTRLNNLALAELRTIARDNILTVDELRTAGLSSSAISNRCRPGGPWRRLFTSTVLLSNTEPTRSQLLRAAVAHLGPGTIITGIDSLNAHGVGLPPPSPIHLLVPAHRRAVHAGLIIERSSKLPEPVWFNGLPYAPPARAAVDAARREPDEDRHRDVLSRTVYFGLCGLDELTAETFSGGQRGVAGVRTMLRHLNGTACTQGNGQAKLLLRYVPLPPPQWNVTVCDTAGHGIGQVDAWWDDIALGWQVGVPPNERRGHLGYLAMTAAGVVLVRTAHEKLSDIPSVARQLVSAFAAAAARRRPPVRAVTRLRPRVAS
ncbi:hypothetical protein [Amycolatopsis albispora]|uniref:Uncharacterized protein n=1 Tax=Amycolatopsis albispora TaxID=1804986 RepID=A0A344L9X8_9PSEU|nr:hypothetical protein [Amycolatopsis albispora]AXB44852.1 hypothetical protein A4R43_22060 [Amycolatopsis albispora]